MSARLVLRRRSDDEAFLKRWGLECRAGGIFLHKMEAPDPGIDLHNHPWTFWSLVLWGGYWEERINESEAVELARFAEDWDRAHPDALDLHLDEFLPIVNSTPRGYRSLRLPLSGRKFSLDECHRIVHLRRKTCWTILVHGPRRAREWGFFTPDGWVGHTDYDRDRRDVYEQ